MANTYNPNTNITIPNGGYSTTGSSTVTLTGAGSGYVLATGAGASGTSYTTAWANPNTNFNDGNEAVMTIPHGAKTVEIAKSATLDVKGNVRINGIDLEERLERIETLLQIPTRDVTMEAKYPKLKKIWEEYNRELAKLKTWDALKGTDDD